SNCAACGNSGDNLKPCTACKFVKYCNLTCQKAHRPKHEKACKKRAAEVLDEALFKQPPPNEDCPICFLRLPLNSSEIHYKSCCGKTICFGCAYVDASTRDRREQICPFCRAPAATSHEGAIERLKIRIGAGDSFAMYILGGRCFKGYGVLQDSNKALELWQRAANLGCATSQYNVGSLYFNGEGVEKDVKKAKYHYGRAAMGGVESARYSLGIFEGGAGNINRAMKHFMISAACGHDNSLKEIQNGFSDGHVTKDEVEKALCAHKEYKGEMQSDQRGAARRWLNVRREQVRGRR
ncbi:hypothetical protein ACHAXR_004247, partial [Thalassiosira sp. AJA248-18]